MNQVIKTFLILLVMYIGTGKAQQTWVLRNNTNCSVGVTYEYSDPPGCPQNGCFPNGCYTPCNGSSAVVTIPAAGSITLTACGNGFFGELCVIVNEVDLIALPTPVHTARAGWQCCQTQAFLSGNYPSGANCAGAFNISWNIVGRTWTIF